MRRRKLSLQTTRREEGRKNLQRRKILSYITA
jgi:hypothetical protein